jgi:tetraacyldisaccharide 4'-kinase
MSQGFAERLSDAWYQRAFWPWLFLPLTLLFALILFVRNLFQAKPSPSAVPVLVVGNITAGGTGKSPLVSCLVRHFESKGLRVGIVSRGYGVKIPGNEVRIVEATSKASAVGDEPLMLKRLLGCDIALSPERALAVDALSKAGVELVIADDGLQHYRMYRDLEVCVIDGKRGLGNGQLLPVGPLRESASRLATVDAIVCNGTLDVDLELPTDVFQTTMQLVPKEFVRVDGKARESVEAFVEKYKDQAFSAIAAIGNPQRFFDTLTDLGLSCEARAFPDHHAYRQADIDACNSTILMTEKDAAKCRDLDSKDAWFLRVEPELQDNLGERLYNHLKDLGRL